MGNGYLAAPVIFLIDTLLGLYVLVVLLRFLLQTTRADFYNPISQFILKVTDPALRPLRRLIPGWGGIDNASLVLLFVVQCLALLLLGLISGAFADGLSVPGLLMATITKLVSLLLYVYLFGIFILALLSWISPGGYNPVAAVIANLTEPVMRPARRMIPPIGGIDLSPMAVILAIYVLRMLIMPPLMSVSVQLGFPLGLARLVF
ncbi:YggT family protein [Sulfuriflexus sp.]|uniref:YggT family protein n=1 Tax=Sulfuriflexus sp. TaxID=2015443 RepID=UPI0028CEB720|nr:YggT family protein [Sulfuriflexus sp.]MDT8404614.1 YggT family protein [Sulfuriflexus sp.]